MADYLLLVLEGLLWLLCFSIILLKWNQVKYQKKGLPPGTMGWPVVGETIQFLKQGPDFMKSQGARYGRFFKTHILGCPTIVSMDPDMNRYILMNESKGLVSGYPQSMLHMLGKGNIAGVHGSAHRHMRGSLLSLVSTTMIRDQLLSKIDQVMRSFLADWGNSVVDIQQKTKEMAFLSSLKQAIGVQAESMSEAFMAEVLKIFLGTISLPIDLPGTSYRQGLQARNNTISMLRKMMKERRASMEIHDDMLGCMMRNDENRKQMTDEEIIDQVITILYSGFETVSTTTMMALKYLHDHPDVLQKLREEHLEIRGRKTPEDPIDWDDLKSMRLTRAVIYETSRLATVVNGVFRKSTHDLELNGFMIPKGWRIYVYTREMNYNSHIYPDPLAFNPWRWLEDKSAECLNYNLLFGAGTRLCPGKELGIAEISVFLHYFVTRYRWKEVGKEKLMKFPRVKAPNGLHIRVETQTDNVLHKRKNECQRGGGRRNHRFPTNNKYFRQIFMQFSWNKFRLISSDSTSGS